MSAYHGNVVWPFEQAFLHAAATRHGLHGLATVAARVAGPLKFYQGKMGIFPERLQVVDAGELTPQGPPNQQWSIAAHVYFASLPDATLLHRDTLSLTASETKEPIWGAPLRFQVRYRVALHQGLEALAGGNATSVSRLFSTMRCLDGKGYGALNNGKCECEDGSDEPGGQACAEKMRKNDRQFRCHHGASEVPYSSVGDGTCDCCDGSDELGDLASHCPHACAQ